MRKQLMSTRDSVTIIKPRYEYRITQRGEKSWKRLSFMKQYKPRGLLYFPHFYYELRENCDGCVFNVHGFVRRESMSIIVQQEATMYSLLYFCKLLYMFRVVTPPFTRSIYTCNYSIWHWSNFGKCSAWSQLKMRVMDRTVSATFRYRTIAECNRDGRVHTSHL
jgi:hypothetical protein